LIHRLGNPPATGATAIRALLFSLCLLFSQAIAAEEITGKVTRVFDGDSFIIASTAGKTIEVRLAGIDAPEKNQPYADKARSALRGLILDRKLRLAVLDVDRYGRKVARAYREPDGLDVNAELIRRGQVWVYRRRAYDASLYDLEREARDHKLGLWALPESEREPPWRWRLAHPPEHRPPTDQNVPSPAASMSR
jgi:endonuclease YncB( thermonuclease family)